MDYLEEIILEKGDQESTRVEFTGVFQQFFEEETELNLVAVVESCTAGANEIGVCRKIPEPSNRLALLLLLCCGGMGAYFSRIMKQIIQFIK